MRQNAAKEGCLPYWCVSHNILGIGHLPLSDMLHTKEKWYAHLKNCAAGKKCPFCQDKGTDKGTDPILFGTAFVWRGLGGLGQKSFLNF